MNVIHSNVSMAAVATQPPAGVNEHTSEIMSLLGEIYPDAHIALTYTNPWELLVAVILSAQCTDVMVNKVTARLFVKYPTLVDYVHADPGEFETDIKSTGFFHNKAANILETARRISTVFGGQVPAKMSDLLTLPGVARKTANIVLSNAYGVIDGIAVDTHVNRLSQRLRLVPLTAIGGKKPRVFMKEGSEVIDFYPTADSGKIELQLMQLVPKSEWNRITYKLIDHGRALCKAPAPRCGECPLSSLCPASRI